MRQKNVLHQTYTFTNVKSIVNLQNIFAFLLNFLIVRRFYIDLCHALHMMPKAVFLISSGAVVS